MAGRSRCRSASALLLSAAALLPSAGAVRRDGASTLRASAELAQQGKAGLRVFAASFNGGNQVYEAGNADFVDLTEKLTQGHEDPGMEADILMVGLQEFSDELYDMGKLIGGKKVWQRQTAETIAALYKEALEAATPPAEVIEAKKALHSDLSAFHTSVGESLARFREQYGEGAAAFHAHLAKKSSVNALLAPNEDFKETADTRDAALARLKRHEEAKKPSGAPQEQFARLAADSSTLLGAADGFPDAGKLGARFQPIRSWATGALEKIGRVKGKFPNLSYTSEGLAAWSKLEASLTATLAVEGALKARAGTRQQEFKAQVELFHAGVKEAVRAKEEEIATKLTADWQRLADDIQAVSLDLKAFDGDGLSKRIAAGAGEAAAPAGRRLQEALRQWSEETASEMEKLLQPSSLELSAEHVQVELQPQKWYSGKLCAMSWEPHYDTMLYAYVNPWSAWKVTQVPYSSSTCAARTSGSQETKGCAIDNINGLECGKVVNLLVFDAEREGASLRLCAMNTHMSAKGTAAERMASIKGAMSEAKTAKCDSVVFVGDFNTRLHCDLAPTGAAAPPYDTPLEGSSFKNVVRQVCGPSGDNCALKGEYDELDQILREDTIKCYEEFERKKGWKSESYWERVEIANAVKGTGLQEVQVPSFPPTYKLASPEAAAKVPSDWKLCLPGQAMCFANKAQKAKNNPAWTDRILVQASAFTTAEYARRSVRGTLKSDHAIVVAQLEIMTER